MRSSFLFASPLLRAALLTSLPALLSASVTSCGSADPVDPAVQPQPDSSTTAETTGEDSAAPDADASTGEVADTAVTPTDTGTVATDTAVVDTGPPPVVTCTKAPTFGTAIRVNHNLDSLRRVQNAGMALLDDGRVMVAMLEDTGSRYGVFARVVDPLTQKASDDERLDVDADNLVAGSAFSIFAIAGGAVGVRYGDGHLKVYSAGKWSPDIAPVLPISDTVGYLASSNGEVLVTRAKASAPYGQAVVYRPNEGGTKGSWSTATTLDLDAATTPMARIDRHVLSDGSFLVMLWQGTGGPAIRTRSLSGAWSPPSLKGEIGSVDTQPTYRVLPDRSIVLVALETQAADTKRAVTSTWAGGTWTTSRLLSKPTATTNGAIPANGQPVLFDLGPGEVEFVAWVAPCVTNSVDCTFEAVTRRYSAGNWQDPIKLNVGPSNLTGAGGLLVQSIAGNPLVARTYESGTKIDLRTRFDATSYKPQVSLLNDVSLFGAVSSSAQFYGTRENLWALVRRDTVTDAGFGPPIVAAMGRINQTGNVAWGTVAAGAYELRTFNAIFPYADGAGGFTVGANNATDGSNNVAIIAHAGPAGGTPEAAPAQASGDESSASFVAMPRTEPRPGRDKSVLYVVQGNVVVDGGPGGARLRAYGYNGIGSRAAKVLAQSDRQPRIFPRQVGEVSDPSLQAFGCGGAILYATDPADGSHTLELVFMGEPGSGVDGGL